MKAGEKSICEGLEGAMGREKYNYVTISKIKTRNFR